MEHHRPHFKGGTNAAQYIHIRQQEVAGTHGGTFTAGSWQTRVLNTIVTDETGVVTLASDQFVLPAGTYIADIELPVMRVLHVRGRLYNITDGEDTLLSNSQWVDNGADSVQSATTIYGQFTISVDTTFEAQHWGTETEATTGFGQGNNLDSKDEVHSTVQLWKIA